MKVIDLRQVWHDMPPGGDAADLLGDPDSPWSGKDDVDVRAALEEMADAAPEWKADAGGDDTGRTSRLLTRDTGRRFASTDLGNADERLILDRAAPLSTARAYLARRATGDGLSLVLYHNGFIYRWDGRCFREAEEVGVRSQLYDFLDSCDEQKGDKRIPFRPRQHGVTEVLDALKAETFLPAELRPPAWRVADDMLPPANEMLVAGNSAIHLPTGRVMPVTPRLFTVGAVEYARISHMDLIWWYTDHSFGPAITGFS